MVQRHGFSPSELVKLFLLVASALGVVFAALGWAFLQWSEWRFVPSRILAMEKRVAALPDQLAPSIVEFRGRGIATSKAVKAGDRMTITYVVRRAISCETNIRVRFYSHSVNVVVGAYDIPAVKSPVSESFSPFPVQVRIPADLPPGVYSYWPEIIPIQCGVYKAITPPMSDPFEVIG